LRAPPLGITRSCNRRVVVRDRVRRPIVPVLCPFGSERLDLRRLSGPLCDVARDALEGVGEVARAGDVVAREDAASAPAAEVHHDLLRDTGANQVPGRAAPEIVEEEAVDPCRLRRAAPRLPEVPSNVR